MNKKLLIITLLLAVAFGFMLNVILTKPKTKATIIEIRKNDVPTEENLKLGAFSISLSVENLETSKEFYEKLGFKVKGGDMAQNYIVMKNENAIIGLFQGMFEGNILTFNPGWDENGENIEKFDDIRIIQQKLIASGIDAGEEIDGQTSGIAHFITSDPDGNAILIDQHR